MRTVEERLEALERVFKDTLAVAAQAKSQTAMLAQIAGTTLARACANSANPEIVMEQLLQIFDTSCLGALEQLERDEIGLGDAQKTIVDVVRLSAEGTLAGIRQSRFQQEG
ncbi:hypothetical protein LHT11_08855 [Acetobacter indonesiensis]|uniref:hypothetical protein n=1 Tax=Acetobacter indonesiensis TaxID=104101 RepID=UPI001F353C3D|nr:hypothetical protein [Acetobacter indonesiensis]MCG0995309.1 hypothetical protein [Acetobacter indonesiensis]